ncbi:MAG TPA: cation-transporting P-type ATPase [Miltoncostaeaceae bacterium]|nr:cation-transporting P-type ATPase [Miltoncostaeaceae bacterium]
MTEPSPQVAEPPPHSESVEALAARLGSDPQNGLSADRAGERLRRDGENRIRAEAQPSLIAVGALQLRDPMNMMLIAVTAASFVIGQTAAAIILLLLLGLNVILGTRQDLAARASVDGLAKIQVPQTRVVRDGGASLIPAAQIVVGDLIQLEAGDLVPADARLVRSATLETQEAALTGESAPIAKSPGVLPDPDTPLAERTNMLFQNTLVTRGTATAVVTATGMRTEMGRIAQMLGAISRTRSPLQRELGFLTRVIGIIAWGAVAVIVVVGIARGLPVESVLLLGIAMAISAIPTGMPTFVQGMLSRGASELARTKALVRSLNDVETLGAVSVINSDKTGTLTLNQMMVSRLYAGGTWFHVEGEGYSIHGAIRAPAGVATPDFTRLGYGLVLASDATVSDAGEVVGDPTEAALVVLAAKLGVDAEESRRLYPRLAEVPFDSDYKFMATLHRVPLGDRERLVMLVKGAPDVVLDRCAHEGTAIGPPMPLDRERIGAANERMGADGLRVLAFAVRVFDDDQLEQVRADPMGAVGELTFVSMVGIIDPLRPEAKAAVATAHAAGIDVRMITGDHAVTARAIGEELGLGPGAISGAELAALSDEELAERLPQLHVFGRVTPEDKLRLARVMQEGGAVVAMTGDAVNDAAALKQADIGVAMGSGSEVTKQAARMILTDDNFGTLVHAVELGRNIYGRIVSYVRYQMTQLLALVLLFLTASAANINDGVALTPLMVLFLSFAISIFSVIVIAQDPGDPRVMERPPRDPRITITNRRAVVDWVIHGIVMFLAALGPLLFGPDDLHPDAASVSMTMTFVVLALATVGVGFVCRREHGSCFAQPVLPAVKLLAIPVVIIVLCTELSILQRNLLTVRLTGAQWLVCIGLALLAPAVIEGRRWLREGRAGAASENHPAGRGTMS